MTDQADLSTAPFWEARSVRGVPLHLVLPAVTALIGLAALASGGLLAWLGGWVLTLGFSLAVGAFVRSPWALAAPAGAWVLWLVISRVGGDPLAQTPFGAASLLAALGAAAAWLGQRAILPAVAGDAPARHARANLAEELEALLEQPAHLADSPSLDPSAEVDEALADLLDGGIDVVDPDDRAPAPDAPTSGAQMDNAQAEVEPEPSADGEGELGLTEDDDPTGHVIEFTALREVDDRP
ncbi:MAG: hypothetical protein PGN13_14440 [Patulibacter minatonensis]